MKAPITIGTIQNGIKNFKDQDKYSLKDALLFFLKQGIVTDQIDKEMTFEQLLCCKKQFPEPILIIGKGTVYIKEDLYKGASTSETYQTMMILINTEPHILFPFSEEDKGIWLDTQII